jgi:hypothetical protein
VSAFIFHYKYFTYYCIFLLTKRFQQEIKGIMVLRLYVPQLDGVDKLNR